MTGSAEARIALASRALDGASAAAVRQFAVDQVAAQFQAARVSLILWDPERRQFRFAAAVGVDPELLAGAEITVRANVLEQCLKQGALFCADMTQDGRFGRPKKLRYRSATFAAAAVPGSGATPRGFLCVSEPNLPARQYREADAEWLSTFAGTLAHVLRASEERENHRRQVQFDLEEARARDLQRSLSGKTRWKTGAGQGAVAFREGSRGASLFSSAGPLGNGGFFALWIQSERPHRLPLAAVSGAFAVVEFARAGGGDPVEALEHAFRAVRAAAPAKETLQMGALVHDGKKGLRFLGKNSRPLWLYRRGEGNPRKIRPSATAQAVKSGDWWILPPQEDAGTKTDAAAWSEFVMSRRDVSPSDMCRELVSQWSAGEGLQDALALAVSFTSSRS